MRITVGISSGIAAYKILELIKLLQNDGHEIKIILTSSARYMISPYELEQLVGKDRIYSELFPKDFNINKILTTHKVDHIEVARNTNLFVIAPATANLIAKMAHGIADDFLTTTLLATHSPVLVFPSMNTDMWYHPAVQSNVKTLQSFGYEVITPATGELACGTDGVGRLPEPKDIEEYINEYCKYQNSLSGKKVLITSGGTSEPIDAVRVITNRSSGKMGVSLAEECVRRGAKVVLLRSSTSINSSLPMKEYTFESSLDLEKLMKENIKDSDIIFHAAAVSDFTVERENGKIESKNVLNLHLKPTPKILYEIKKWNSHVKLIGFKAVYGEINETLLKELSFKKEESHTDAFVINNIKRTDIGFESNENEVDLFYEINKITHLPKASKRKIAAEIINTLLKDEILH